MKSNRWYLVAICILLLLWLGAEWRLWHINSEIDRIYVKEVTLRAVDADTMKPLPIHISGPSMRMGQHWPKLTYTATGESEMRLRWVDIGPLKVGVSAEGYQEQELQLDQHSEDRIFVLLQR